jgi:hypothetical protein
MFMLPNNILKLTAHSKDNLKNILTYSYYSFCDLKCMRRENSITRLKNYLGDPYDSQIFYSSQMTNWKRIHGSFCN